MRTPIVVVLPYWSFGVTLTLNVAPTVTELGAVTRNETAVPGATAMLPLVAVCPGTATLSVTVWAMSRVTETTAEPLVTSTILSNSWSLLVMVTSPFAGLPKPSLAEMVASKATPALAVPARSP